MLAVRGAPVQTQQPLRCAALQHEGAAGAVQRVVQSSVVTLFRGRGPPFVKYCFIGARGWAAFSMLSLRESRWLSGPLTRTTDTPCVGSYSRFNFYDGIQGATGVEPYNQAGVGPYNQAGVGPCNQAGVDPCNQAGVEPYNQAAEPNPNIPSPPLNCPPLPSCPCAQPLHDALVEWE